MTDLSRGRRSIALLALLALGACAVTLVGGMVASLAYTSWEPAVRRSGLTLQHLRPIHESFAFAWVFLGGIAVVHAWLISLGGPLAGAERLRFRAMIALWCTAGAGILVSLLAGRFTGREYAGYHPAFGAMILGGWGLFAWNFFARAGFSLRGKPVYVWMWSAAIPLFVITFLEANAYTLDWVSRRPLRDIAIQWKSNGVMVGCFNLLAYGSILWVSGVMRGDDRYSRSATGFLLFSVGIINTFTNYGHHTFHLPQTPWVHWVSFLVSMLEVVILAKVMLDLWNLRRRGTPAEGLALPARFGASVTLWTFLMLATAIAMSVPPVNSLIHGTHIVTAHAMGTMIGIDSMILWCALSWIAGGFAGPGSAAARRPLARHAVTVLDISLFAFLALFAVRGAAAGLARQLGPSAPDLSVFVARFPGLMVATGWTLAASALWLISGWALVFARVLRSGPVAPGPGAPDPAPVEGARRLPA
ncbi:MAG: cbb3-type cytochrome c oxidase subunit I [Candidatus Brocadiae bacterium]|nr:cbb3-type cytochrome c oxidase subunit I [Candidatus Brocadiia bacterium]